MPNLNRKSSTDLHWDDRAGGGQVSDEKINIGDTVQRELETDFVMEVLPKGARILEVGCGNGHLTKILREKAGFVDAFDYAANMIEKATSYAGEKNNRFFVDNVLEPKNVQGPYDAIVCVRVLINLQDLEEQKRAIENLAGLLKPGGKLILVEGYKEGFDSVSKLRTNAGLPPLQPAAINFYSHLSELQPTLDKLFTIGERWHSGMFDYLTRVVYPLLVGAGNVQEAGDFHMKTLPLTRTFNPESFAHYGRLQGLELTKK